MAPTYKCIVIDMDGTLYPGSKNSRMVAQAGERLRRYALRMKAPRRSIEEMVEKYISRGKATYPTVELSNRHHWDRARALRYVYDVRPESFGIRRDRKLIGILTKLSREYELAVFTNSPDIWVNRTLSAIGIRGLFRRSRIITLNKTGNGALVKPSKEAFLSMLRQLKMKPQEIVFLDDGSDNMKTAAELGIRAMQISDRGDRASGRYTIYEALSMLDNK